tara:strand:+ start:154 stop:642 length:489 start_codon:yes stop_codon:yes gene_type:complete
MIKGIMAVDDTGGISRGKSMPWPKNSLDLQWFKKNTINCVVVMGRKTWEDPFMPTPLKSRVNVLITKNDSNFFPGADNYINKDVNKQIYELQKIHIDKDIFIIGGSEIIKLTIDIIQEFYLTRIYGNYNCEKFLDISMITNNMKLSKKIEGDNTCHFEIWKR